MNTNTLTDQQIKDYYLEHVRYEVQMLLNMARGIVAKLEIHDGLKYAPIESFVIHLRNLITFLYPAVARSDDVVAADYFLAEGAWGLIRPNLSTTLSDAKIRADKEVGHLTTARQNGTPASKVWDVKGLSNEIMGIMQIFCDSTDRVDLRSTLDDLQEINTRIQSLNL